MLQPIGMHVAEVEPITTFLSENCQQVLPRFQAMTRTFVEASDDTGGGCVVVEVVE